MDTSRKLHPTSEGDCSDAYALLEEIVPLSLSLNSGSERNPRTESSEIVVVSVSESETIALPSLAHEKEQ